MFCCLLSKEKFYNEKRKVYIMGLEIKAEIENLKNILLNGEKFYQIPDYQRPYFWEQTHLSQ